MPPAQWVPSGRARDHSSQGPRWYLGVPGSGHGKGPLSYMPTVPPTPTLPALSTLQFSKFFHSFLSISSFQNFDILPIRIPPLFSYVHALIFTNHLFAICPLPRIVFSKSKFEKMWCDHIVTMCLVKVFKTWILCNSPCNSISSNHIKAFCHKFEAEIGFSQLLWDNWISSDRKAR